MYNNIFLICFWLLLTVFLLVENNLYEFKANIYTKIIIPATL